MAGFPLYQDFKDAIEAGQIMDYTIQQTGGSVETGTSWGTLWGATGRPFPVGVAPATTPGTVYDNTAGGIVFPNTSPLTKFLYSVAGSSTSNPAPGTMLLVDRLVGVGGISVASTGNKTVNTQALTRYTSGEGVQAWLEVTTANATSAVVLSMISYTNQNGTGSRVGGSITFPTTATNATTMIGPMPLADGDTGVRSVETLDVSTAGTAGVVSLILVKPLVRLGIDLSLSTQRLSPLPYSNLVRIYDGATLFFMTFGYSGAESFSGEVGVVYN